MVRALRIETLRMSRRNKHFRTDVIGAIKFTFQQPSTGAPSYHSRSAEGLPLLEDVVVEVGSIFERVTSKFENFACLCVKIFQETIGHSVIRSGQQQTEWW